MRKPTFTIFTDDNKVCGYLFGVTRLEAQETVSKMIAEDGKKYYYMDGYMEG